MHVRVTKKIVDKNGRMLGVVAVTDTQKPEPIEIRREDLSKYTFDNARISADNKVYCTEAVPVEVFKPKGNIVRVYHGSPNQSFTPQYGKGEDKHDYGRGFYLTQSYDLACEWAVSNIGSENTGYVHGYDLDITGLKIFDFEALSVEIRSYRWLAELLQHRDGDNTRAYRLKRDKFIEKYGVDLSSYDIIKGYRADSSYFFIAKNFVKGNIGCNILEEMLRIGDLGIQVCLKSKKAFDQLQECGASVPVKGEIYYPKYQQRDTIARDKMRELMDSERNDLSYTITELLK